MTEIISIDNHREIYKEVIEARYKEIQDILKRETFEAVLKDDISTNADIIQLTQT